MSANAYLAVLFVCVIIGLAGGLWGGLWVAGHLPDSLPEVVRGIATLLTIFLCCAAGVGAMYGVAYYAERFFRGRQKAKKAEAMTYHEKRTSKKRRKKR